MLLREIENKKEQLEKWEEVNPPMVIRKTNLTIMCQIVGLKDHIILTKQSRL